VVNGKSNSAVMAVSQSLGRGRREREWRSPVGGLWFSFDVPYTSEIITIKVGVAVREVCSEFYGCKVLLKWPNDLILDGKKVGGILCEKVQDRVVIGIGINTNVKNIGVENSISFLDVCGKVIDNRELMERIIDKFFDLRSESIISEFRKNMAFIGEEKFISAINKKAKIIGISDEGHLVIDDNSEEKNVFVGEILIDNN
jgi:BirA family biotin operon repressor/biotin-[acetyl-CoA-carboxylase] ligase